MKRLFIILIVMMIIPFSVNAEEYYLNNLKEDQKFFCGDRIVYQTPSELLLLDENTLRNKYGSLENRYGGEFIFYDLNSIQYSETIRICYSPNCGIVDISCFPDGKDKYWEITNVELLDKEESFKISFSATELKPTITITNMVNDTDKYNAKKNEILKYSVKVQNTGDGYSKNNIISTVVPKGLEIDKNRISDNGVYNEKDNIITWNLDVLNPNSEYTLYYYAKIVDDDIKQYIGHSYLTSNQVSEKVESDNTIVNVENKKSIPDMLKNPKTGTSISMIVITVALLISFITYKTLKRKKKYMYN